jgi:adenylate cyclase
VTLSFSAARKVLFTTPRARVRAIFISGGVLTVFVSLFYLYQPTFLRILDHKLYDILVRSAPLRVRSGVPLIVDLDEKSLAQFGQWPWPRYRVALLLKKLKDLGASSIGLDMVFAEPDRTSFGVMQREVLRDLKINVEFKGLPKSLVDNDQALAGILSHGPFVLGYKFTFAEERQPDRSCLLHPFNVAVLKTKGVPDGAVFLFSAKNVVCNLPTLGQAAPSSGFFNVVGDFDGILRRVPLLIEHQGKFYPSLSLATLAQALGVNQVALRVTREGVASMHFGDVIIPLDAKGNLLIHYRGKGKTFDYISAGDVLSNLIPKERVQGRIVFLGTTAAGLGEFRTTPLDAFFPGVEIHATLVDNILKRDFVSRPNWVPGVELLVVIGSGILSTLLLGWTGTFWSLLALSLEALGLWEGSRWLFQSRGLFLSPLIPFVALGGNFSFLTLYKYWREEKEVKARIRELALTRDFTIQCLASLIETRHRETGGHILRTQRYVRALCRRLVVHPGFRKLLDPEAIEDLYKSAPLHDIGKVGISDSILLKPGGLTRDEFEEIKKHTTYGRDAIQRAEEKFGYGTSSSFLRLAKEVAYTHHEKWNGSGYPEGLAGERIPLSGRIMAVADVYDGMICERIYKPSMSHEDAVSFITSLKGIVFDPDVVDAFLEVHEEFRQISRELEDRSPISEAVGMKLY